MLGLVCYNGGILISYLEVNQHDITCSLLERRIRLKNSLQSVFQDISKRSNPNLRIPRKMARLNCLSNIQSFVTSKSGHARADKTRAEKKPGEGEELL